MDQRLQNGSPIQIKLLKVELGRWQGHLEKVVDDYQSGAENLDPSTKNANLRGTLTELQESLDSLRRKHLAETDKNNVIGDLYTGFEECSVKLDQAKASLLPKASFTFRRYRKAWKERQTTTSTRQDKAKVTKPDPISDTLSPAVENPLANKSHVSMVVTQAERIVTRPMGDTAESLKDSPSEKELCLTGGSLLIVNIQHSCIQLQNSFQELHISNVSHSTIRVDSDTAISGALHMTNCNHVDIHVKSFHQLRIHESNNLKIHIADAERSGGAIMEESNNVVFSIAPKTPTASSRQSQEHSKCELLDVKDFSWLHRGVPSPNFRVDVLPTNSIVPTKNASIRKTTSDEQPFVTQQTEVGTSNAETQLSTQPQAEQEDSDDDEL
ncbi:expressed unknown protein [Seminavis robusta]|uniref:C-CAP/cofactor C-like domain-containing protein n=1 Tax=Seminavis robusta TaxID=568900 RepID=A0A9N8E3X0_9STRA|nr:expressed unknown protein [Seminavis robusta]|eukprot:Sro518_g158880.1 n/a (383) ;mRNA; r:48380-49528